MTSNNIRSLTLNVTASATWTQVKEEVANTGYLVPATGHGDVRSLIVTNLGVNSVVVEFAISANNTPTDQEKAIPGCTLATLEHGEYDGVIVIVAAKGLWIKCTGTSPNVTIRSAVFEVVP